MGTRDVVGLILLGVGLGLAGWHVALMLRRILRRLWKTWRMGPRLALFRYSAFFCRHPTKPSMDWLHIRMSREFYDDLRSLGVSPLVLWVEPTGTPLADYKAEFVQDPEPQAECEGADGN